MANINEGWAMTQTAMAEAFRADGPNAALAVGEEFASTVRPRRVEGFRLRDVVFRHLVSHRRAHGITLDSHLAWSVNAALDDPHPLRSVARLSSEVNAASDNEARARSMASRGKVLFSMGYVHEAEKQYHEALLIDECSAARLGKAAVLRHRMYQMPKGISRGHLWDEAVELVDEVLSLEETNPIARELMDSLKGDARWL